MLDLLGSAGTGEERLSLYLRSLRAAPAELSREVRSRVKALLVHLGDVQYAVPAEDLARALDLTAAFLPRRLRRVLDGVFAAPGSDAQVLRAVADTGEEESLLSELLERAETYPRWRQPMPPRVSSSGHIRLGPVAGWLCEVGVPGTWTPWPGACWRTKRTG